jgi:putative chitinase
MFPLEPKHLIAAGVRASLVDRYLNMLNDAMREFDITTGERPAMFLAQIAHESMGLYYVAEIWGPTPAQLRYPDGPAWKGHGFIQITHEENHLAEAEYFGIPPSDIVRWLQSPEGACRSAAHYWRSHGCNEAADAFDFVAVTKKINGGTNGLADRLSRYKAITEIA